MILTIDDVIGVVNNWKSNNNIVGDLNFSQLSKFTSDIRSAIDQMDFAIANDSSVVLYSGKSGSVPAWKVVDSATKNSGGRLTYISNFDAGKMLNTGSAFEQAVIDVVGKENIEYVMHGYDNSGVRVNTSSFDDCVSSKLVKSGKGELFIYAPEGIDSSKVLASTEIQQALNSGNYTSINGIDINYAKSVYKSNPNDFYKLINDTSKIAVNSGDDLLNQGKLLLEATQQNGAFDNNNALRLLDSVNGNADDAISVLNKAGRNFDKAIDILGKVGGNADETIRVISAANNSVDDALRILGKTGNNVNKAVDILGKVGGNADDAVRVISAANNSVDDALRILGKTGNNVNKAVDILGKVSGNADDAIKVVTAANNSVDDALRILEKTGNNVNKTVDILGKVGGNADDAARIISAANNNVDDALRILANSGNNVDDAINILGKVGGNVEDAIKVINEANGIIDDAIKILDAADDIAKADANTNIFKSIFKTISNHPEATARITSYGAIGISAIGMINDAIKDFENGNDADGYRKIARWTVTMEASTAAAWGGAAIGTAIGGPVGFVVGFVLGVGFGFAADYLSGLLFDEIWDLFADAADAQPPRDPLAIDLGALGINLTTLENGVNFDLDKNGFAEKTAWIGIEDGFLVLDRNRDGIINDGGELFGDQVEMSNGLISASGFEALADLDENADGVIDHNDSIWNDLRIWVDANHNGVSDSGELKTFNELGIVSISLDVTREENVDTTTGTMEAEFSMVIFADGTQRKISEFWFPVNTNDTTQTDENGEIIKTIGTVPDISQAIAEDDSGRLAELYKAFCSSDDFVNKRYLLKQILYFITDATDINPNARGGNIDARDLKIIEAFMGREFMGVGGKNPNANAANILKKMYTAIENMYFNTLNAKTEDGRYLDTILGLEDENGEIIIDLSLLNMCLEFKIGNGENIDNLIYSVGSYLALIDEANSTSSFKDFSAYCGTLSPHYANILELSKSGNTYLGTDGNDGFQGTSGTDFIFGEVGNDTLSGGNGNDFVYGGDGSDTIYGDAGNDTLHGDDGNDTLFGGSGNDMLYGENGDDVLDGGTGNDILYGGAGNDTYVFAKGYGSDTIIDSDGLNTLRFNGLNPLDILVNGTGDYDATITIKGTNDTLVIKDFRKGEEYANYDLEFDGVKMHVTDQGSPFRHIYGGNGDDVLKAVVDDSIMHAFGGIDTVYGSDGNDIIYGNEGDDVLYAGSGNDLVYGGDGDDILDGGEGDDFLYGGSGNDTYVFGRNYGTDIISDSEGVSTIKIADGISLDELDIISVGENIVISLSDSDDKLIINYFAENPDNYILEVGGERTSLKDRVSAVNDEFLSGSDESDYIVNENSSIVAGGSGDDRIIGNAKDEIIFGDSGNDQILSDSGNDVIFGGSGDDYINGGDGNDMIDGGSGNDFIDGGIGDDIYFFNPGYGNDSIKDSDGANTIMFGDGFTASGINAYRSNWNDLLITFDGFEDTLTIKDYCINENARNFTLVFADGTVVEAAAKDSPLRKIYGTDGSEYMESIYDDGIINDAQASDDQIVGSDGNDTLYGGDGDERITGKAGDDVLDGGNGNDYLSGGAGNDTYIFNKGYGVDTISDGEGTNTININGYSANQIKAYRTNWNDITITFADSEDKIIIEGFFTSEANRNFYLTFNGGGRIHATASNSPLRTIYGTDGDDYMSAVDGRGVTLYGEDGSDNINGGSGYDRLYGGNGNDQLYGNGGNDILDGGEGNDMLYGGAGNDTYIFNVESGTDTIIDSEGINTILFGAGLTEDAMTAYRHNWNDLMITFEGVDDKLIIQGYFGSESNRSFEVRFANGKRYAYNSAENPIKQVHATEYDDWMTAWSDSGIILHGDGGNDNLSGGAGNDILFGGIGNDTLNGNDGDDILDGGEGSDFLYGGLGNDTYRFGIGYGSDIIEDNDGDNKVELLGVNSDAVSFEMTDRGELVITITESGDVLTIRNFDSERFTFEFADEISGTFNVETGLFEKALSEEELAAIEAVKTEDELAQANADILDELYAGDNSVSNLFTEDNSTVISENSAVSDAEDNSNVANQIDVQVMILTENMAAFLNESNISDCVNMQSGTDNFEFANQLLVETQVS